MSYRAGPLSVSRQSSVLKTRLCSFQMGFTDVDSENKPVSFQQIFEAKRNAHLEQLQHDEDEMRQMFVVRVKEKEAELKDIEREVIIC